MPSEEQLTELIRRAARLVDDSGVSEPLRQAAFSKVLDLLSDGSSQGTQGVVGTADSDSNPSPLARIAQRLKTDVQVTGEIFDAKDELQLVFARSKLPLEKGPAMRIVGLITAAGRQAGGYDPEWTSGDLIREQCRQFGVLDRPNFASSLSVLRDAFVVRGSSQQKEYKVTRAGFDEAARLIGRLATGEKL